MRIDGAWAPARLGMTPMMSLSWQVSEWCQLFVVAGSVSMRSCHLSYSLAMTKLPDNLRNTTRTRNRINAASPCAFYTADYGDPYHISILSGVTGKLVGKPRGMKASVIPTASTSMPPITISFGYETPGLRRVFRGDDRVVPIRIMVSVTSCFSRRAQDWHYEHSQTNHT